MIGLEPAERFFDLAGGGFLIATVDFRHQERSLAIAVAERLAHADLALPTVVVPAVIEKVQSVVNCGAHDAYAFGLRQFRPDEMKSAQAYHRNHLPCMTKPPAGNFSRDVRRVRVRRKAPQDRCASGDLQ